MFVAKQSRIFSIKHLRNITHKNLNGNLRHYSSPVEAQDEPLGKQFYVILALIPLSIGLYTVSRPDTDGKLPAITTFINGFSHYQEKWSERNTLHTKAVEQAGYERNLFNSSTRKRRVVDLKFPEIFNTGSPFNVVAGQGPRNMDQLVAHYSKVNADEEERKLRVLKNKQS
ncbi:NADH-ubiquinone oxidoreductase 17.8 kDa subunit, mitochondrial [Golovinomyces cichoracearum]|uniref:NADH-ubiquinone oxidoreductase 17.8 kDa subunit, mitochondrial n=1 Tax=Golovinomyces cichoracearum TaxID=62708 RepID=A0A420I6E1_9PEZI|nr:NADH-ubiquinone oxidoreductase 17.8 kDa subunit, mitochondrial [Golovinomyces cichoracearum]